MRAGAPGHPKVLVKIENRIAVATAVADISTMVSRENPDWLTTWSRFLMARATSATAPTMIRCPVIHPMDSPNALSSESWKLPNTGDARSITRQWSRIRLFNSALRRIALAWVKVGNQIYRWSCNHNRIAVDASKDDFLFRIYNLMLFRWYVKEIGPSNLVSEEMDLWVVSHGGVASNAICDFLETKQIRTRPDNYGLICHKKHPLTSVNLPILVIFGDFESAIRSMDRRSFLTANATKMRYGMDLPEVSMNRLIETKRDDPLGIAEFLESFEHASKTGLDRVEFLRYPYTNAQAQECLSRLGFDVDFEGFALRGRKRKFGLVSKEVKQLLEVYEDYDFEYKVL